MTATASEGERRDARRLHRDLRDEEGLVGPATTRPDGGDIQTSAAAGDRTRARSMAAAGGTSSGSATTATAT